MNKANFSISALILLFIVNHFAFAQTCTFNGGGDGTSWTDGNNWDCGSEPDPSSENVVIPAGFNVVNDGVDDFGFENNYDLTINGSLDMSDKKIEIKSSGSFLTIGSSGSLTDIKELFFNSGGDGLIESGGNLVVKHLKTDDNNSVLTVNSVIEITEKLENLSGSEIEGTGSLIFDCDDDFANNGSGTIFGCSSSDCSECTLDGGSSCTICDEIVRVPDSGNYTPSSNGDIICIVGSGNFSGSVSLDRSNSELCISENVTYTGNLNINRNNAVVNNYGTISGIGLNTQGTFNNYGNLQLTNLNVNNGDFNVLSSSGTVEITGSVIINNGTNVNVDANASVGGDLTINGGGDLNLDGAFVTVAGTLSPGNSANSVNALGSSSGCEGISFTVLNLNNSNSFSGNVDICNLSDPNSTPTLSGSTRCECSGLLPVEFINYSTRYDYDQEVVEVNWSTASEQNSASFVIERSNNGYDFEVIGSVSAASNSEEVNNYSFMDQTPLAGKLYYRIKQIDIDGTFTYTNVIVQHFKGFGAKSEMDVSVAQQLLQLNFPNYVESGQLEVINSLGQLVNAVELNVNAFSTNVNIELKGFYVLRFRTKEKIWVRKVFIN